MFKKGYVETWILFGLCFFTGVNSGYHGILNLNAKHESHFLTSVIRVFDKQDATTHSSVGRGS